MREVKVTGFPPLPASHHHDVASSCHLPPFPFVPVYVRLRLLLDEGDRSRCVAVHGQGVHVGLVRDIQQLGRAHTELYSRNIHSGGLHADTQYAVQRYPRKRKVSIYHM